MAKAALENALWEAEAKQKASRALANCSGGGARRFHPVFPSGFRTASMSYWKRSLRKSAPDTNAIKVKVRQGWDLDVLEQIRKRLAGEFC